VPTVAEERRAPPGCRRVASYPDRYRGWRLDDMESFARCRQLAEELVGDPVPLLVRTNAQRLELAAEVADADAQDETITAESRDRSGGRRHLERMPVRRHEYVGPELDASRPGQAPRAQASGSRNGGRRLTATA
jgi:hypothetical protein